MRKFRQQPYSVPCWIYPALLNLKPRERLTVSEWAAKNRVMPDSNAIPGGWNNSVTPYLVEIMNAFSDDTIEKIVLVKPTQIGGTSALENMLGCLIMQDPAPTMIVYPSDELATRTVEAKFEPMIKLCKPLAAKFRENESKGLQLKFDDMNVYLTGSNSAADLASTNIRYLFLDEIDKFPGASKKEADPISLAIERTKSYTTNKKIFMTSTPTIRSGHIWRQKEEAEVEKHYFVPCPHCGEYIELVFAQLKWESKETTPDNAARAASAVYVCQKCGCVISESEKPKMLAAGRWQNVRGESKNPKSVAFWLNTLYSPFTTFADIAAEFLRSKDDPELLHNFTNSWLAEPWEDTKLKTNAELVLERRTELPAYTVPEWAKLLTGGVDVQETSVYWVIRAWGDFMTSQKIASGQALSFSEIERVMNLEYSKPSGEKMQVNLALVDSGDQTDEVYNFCLANAEWALPCKGWDTMFTYYKITVVNKAGSAANGMQMVKVDGGKYKDMIAARMRKPNGKGSWMVDADCDVEYAEQVTAEHKIIERSGGKVVAKWVPKSSHADNHYLDCEVYAAAAADMRGVRTFFLENQDEKPAAAPPALPAPKPPEEEWIKQYDNWI